MKKILCLLSLVSLFAAPLEASSWKDSDGITWYYETLSNGTVSIGTDVYSVSVPSGVEAIKVPTYISNRRVTEIGTNAFKYESGLTSITIPSSVTSISGLAFFGCSRLKEIIVDEANSSYKSEDGLLLTKDGERLVACPGGLTSVTIPEGVTSIGANAFDSSRGLTSVIIPSSLTSIGYQAFRACSGLTSVMIPSNLTSIGEYAFSGCTSLTSVTIPSGVTTIGKYAFSGCTGLMSILISEGVTSIGDYAFRGCTNLISATIPSSVTTIGSCAFTGCMGLTSVVISEGVVEIGVNAFDGCLSLVKVVVPSSITSVGDDAFKDTRIEQLWCYTSPTGWSPDAFGKFSTEYIAYNNSVVITETRSNIESFYCPMDYQDDWQKYFASVDIFPRVLSFAAHIKSIPSILEGGILSFRDKEIAWGETTSITATPNDGYVFLGWSSDVEGIGGSEPTLTFTVPEREEVLLIANFFPKAVLTTLVNETLNATLDTKVDARIDAKIDGEKLLMAEQAATKTSATINQKVADGELITSDQLQVMALSVPVIEVKDGTATVGISVMKASAVDGEWENVTLDADAASVESDKVKVEVPADEKAAFYKFVVPEKQ